MRIVSPMQKGNGAFIVHRQLANWISGYSVCGFDARWTFAPPVLLTFCRLSPADLVHTTPEYAPLLRRRSRPLVVTFHGFNLDRAISPHHTLLQGVHYRTDARWFTRMALDKASAVTAVSQFLANIIRAELGFKPEIAVIHNGVDPSQFSPFRTVKRQHGPIRILYCGNLTRRKGAELIAPLADALGPSFDVVYTCGPRNAQPDKWVPARISNARSLGSLKHEAMPDVYRSVDILFMPSVREGFGLCVAKAMACGLPVVASDTSALPELIDHEKGGYLCPPDDLNAFVDAIRCLADSPARRTEMGAYNRAKVEAQFTLERMVREYRILFERVLAGDIGSARG